MANVDSGGLIADFSDDENEDSAPLLDDRGNQGVKEWLKCRHVMAFMSFLGFVNVYALRVNLSVALVAMVNSSYEEDHNRTSECLADITVNGTEQGPTGEFPWGSKLQGQILGSFFYGYILTQIPGGRLAEMFGGKYLYGFGVLCTALFTLVTPFAARVPGWGSDLLIVVRVLEGIGEGVTFPAMHALLAKWAPPLERSKMGTFIYAGSQFGTVLSLPLSGIICDELGWPYVFYIFGMLACFWFMCWMYLIYNSPAEHPRISTSERQYIEKQIGVTQRQRLPWKSILTSLPVWACLVAHLTYNWGFYTLLTSLPMYMKDVLYFNISSNGILSALPYLVMWITIVMGGQIADRLRSRHILSTTAVRKIFNSTGMIFPAAILVGLGFVKCNSKLAVGLLVAAGAMCGFSQSGYNVNHLDLAHPYAGTLLGITNTAATIPGFLAPQVVGALTNHDHSAAQWRKVFFISSIMYVFGALFFLAFGSGKEQPWAKSNHHEEDASHSEGSQGLINSKERRSRP